MRWITRSHVHVYRVACPWPITRFIDSTAEFLFVPKSKVLEIAETENAVPFDTPGAAFQHRENLCTFDLIIKVDELTNPALLRLALVINAARHLPSVRRSPSGLFRGHRRLLQPTLS